MTAQSTSGPIYDVHTKGRAIALRILHGNQWRGIEITPQEATHIAKLLHANVNVLEIKK